MLLIKHIKGREGAADYMNKKNMGYWLVLWEL